LSKVRIVVDTKHEIKEELKRLSKLEGLSLTSYLILKGLNKLVIDNE